MIFLAALSVVAPPITDPGSAFDVALVALAGIAMVCLGHVVRVPWEVAAAVVSALVLTAVGHRGHLEESLFLVATTTLYAAWHLGSTVRAAAIAGGCSVAIAAAAAVRPDSYSWAPWVAAEIFTFVLGRTLFRQWLLIREVESARDVLARQAVADERRRIARELHDLAGHTLAAMLLHVTGARHVLRRDVDEAERALVDAEAVGRASLDQIRVTVSALRTSERGTDPSLPSADQLDDLVAEYRRTGLSIDASVPADVAGLSGPVAVALHRIGREALANVARHAPANQVLFAVALDGQRVRLEVADHGRRADAPDAAAGQRFGLVGMRERARALGGTLLAEPSADGWRVEAELPIGTERS